jgi:hypothetical protein
MCILRNEQHRTRRAVPRLALLEPTTFPKRWNLLAESIRDAQTPLMQGTVSLLLAGLRLRPLYGRFGRWLRPALERGRIPLWPNNVTTP